MKRILILMATAVVLYACGSYTRVGEIDPDKATSTYSTANLKLKDNDGSSYITIFDYLRGRVPGLMVGPAGPGEMPEIHIRGQGSLYSSTTPLFVVDGMTMEDISTISPLDVESVTVYKDAEAAMYGVRGANGVIVIRTKKAKSE